MAHPYTPPQVAASSRWLTRAKKLLGTAALLLLVSAPALAAPPPAGTVIRNVASATYLPDGYSQVEVVQSNGVQATVATVEALVLTESQDVSRPPGALVTLTHLLSNVGNIPSSYTLTWDATNCPGGSLAMTGLRVVRDANNNGVVDANETTLALNTPDALNLLPGETASLLVEGTLPQTATGTACATLTATTALQGATASNQDTVALSNAAVLVLRKSANYNGVVVPGTTVINFTVNATNIGGQDAGPTNQALPGPVSILVNGSEQQLVLIRDMIPTGTQYIAGSLNTQTPGAVKLFRLPGDAPFSYRAGPANDDASAIEVAIGLPTSVVRNGTVQMQFAVRVLADATQDIRNIAGSYYNDGTQPAAAPSNVVIVPLASARLGVAKAAGPTRSNIAPGGGLDGTSNVTFSLLAKNYGSAWLYNVQLTDLLEGSGASQFGTYTSATVPGPNEYTLVPGSLVLLNPNGTSGGTQAQVNPAFDGTASNANLLAPGAALSAGGEFTVQFTLRINFAGRSGPLFNSARGEAATTAVGSPTVSDVSENGTNPDPDGDGNPGNNSQPTPVSAQPPSLDIVKTTSVPTRISQGVYEFDYQFRVTNNGTTSAPFVRVVDNLNCTFDMDLPSGAVQAWQLVGPVRTSNGLLTPASTFTGDTLCDRVALNNPDPYAMPTALVLNMVDGSRSLAPGQSELVSITVRATLKPSAQGTRVTLTNKAWAGAFDQNTVNVTPAMLVSASSSSVQTLLVDPQGIVYDALSREPVANAVVTLRRTSCTTGTPGPIRLNEIFGGTAVPSRFTENSDGSISMTTAANGEYQFYFVQPPVTGLCDYAISVEPPSGSGYLWPSAILPVTPGVATTCGPVVPNVGAPQDGDSTTHYFNLRAGFDGNNAPCDVIHNHIPLDPGTLSGLILRKDGSKRQVELGDFLDYALTLTNKTGFPLTEVSFTDTLPAGFSYVSGSSVFNGVRVADPVGGAGPALSWAFTGVPLGREQSVMLRYRVRVGVGAPVGVNATNRAQATSGKRDPSNIATHTVRVLGGVFADEAFLIGKVYMDCNADREQRGTEEPGVPGVRLYLEDGTHVITDVEGKWSLYGLKPITHVLRLDQTTLPKGATIELLDNRNSNEPASRFVDLKKGELHKADFPLLGCTNPDTLSEVKRRRDFLAERPDAEGEAIVRTRLDPNGDIVSIPSDNRSGQASGQINGNSQGLVSTTQTTASAPLINMTTGADRVASNFINNTLGAGATGSLNNTVGQASSAGLAPMGALPAGVQPLLPQPAPGAIELEKILPDLDNKPGFIEFKSGDTVASQTVNVRVKGIAGTSLLLSVNGVAIDGRRVGKKATLPSTKTTAWEYIGILLKPGANTLRLDVTDDFGIARGEPVQITVTAPDKLGAVVIELPQNVRADLRTPAPITVRLTDAAGVPVTARTQITLEASAGRWVEEDLNPDEPGHQQFMQGGQAVFHLLPPGEPGEARIRVSAAALVQEVRLPLLPDLRPMIGVGIVEGTIDLTRRGKLAIGQIPAGAAFEQELRSLSDNNDNRRIGGRFAFFLKGAIKGEYLLTAALDTDKNRKDRLFRDIRPDEFYPIYGDSAARGFDAQSSERLYVRIDKNRSYLLYGDFNTSSSTEVRQLSQTNRTLTGIQHVYETDGVRVTSYASQTAQTQQTEEFPARGISGPYFLGGGSVESLIENSERVEILVRDRNQPNVILQTTPVTRFVDYTLEPLTRRILFTRPIASVDGNFNPQSIRVVYEVDGGGDKYTVAGIDAQARVTDRLQLGAVISTDRNPENPRDIAALTALARIGDNTALVAEVVRTQSDLNGGGNAARVEITHQQDKFGASAQVSRTSTDFDNPAASLAAGQTEASVRAEVRVSPDTSVRAEGLYSKNDNTGEDRRGLAASVQTKLSDTVTAEVGLRHGSTNTTGSTSLFDYNQVSSYNTALGSNQAGTSVTALGTAANAAAAATESNQTSVRGRLTANPASLPKLQVYIEAEQVIGDSGQNTAAVGGSYAITDKTRAYGRYEVASGLGNLYDLTSTASRDTGIFGIESNYMEGGRIYNEYRIADSLDGRTGEAAMGIRNTFKLNDQWRATAGIEHTRSSAIGDGTIGQGDSTAITSGLEYTSERVKGSAILEGRRADDSTTVLSSGGIGFKLDENWSLLARSVYSDSQGKGINAGNSRTLSRQQIGLAYRPVNSNTWNALARYEHKGERVRGADTLSGGGLVGSLSGSAFGSNASLPGNYTSHIVSLHVNANPQPGTYYSGRLAAKHTTFNDGQLKSSYDAQLLYGRVTWDLNPNWDVGLQAGLLHGSGGALQKAIGAEVGYQLQRNLWLSVGYNHIGLRDRDLTAGEYTSKGVYLRLRYKFDETNLGFASAGAVRQRAPVVESPRPVAVAPVPAPAPAPAPVLSKTVLQAGALFDFDKDVIKPAAFAELDALAAHIAKGGYEVVLTVGHTDNFGSDAYNQNLSERRAEAVRQRLIAGGVDPKLIRAEGRGETEPTATNATAQGRALNRRVEVTATGAGAPPASAAPQEGTR